MSVCFTRFEPQPTHSRVTDCVPFSALTAGIRLNFAFSELVAVNSTVLVNTSLTTGARPADRQPSALVLTFHI